MDLFPTSQPTSGQLPREWTYHQFHVHRAGNLLQSELESAGIRGFKFQIWTIEEFENMTNLLPKSQFTKLVMEKFNNKPQFDWDRNTYLFELTKLTYLRPPLFITKGETKASKVLRSLTSASQEPHNMME